MIKRITIITGSGGKLGTGHLQRMLSLTDYLKEKANVGVKLILNDQARKITPVSFKKHITDYPVKSDIIIRDKRDSEVKIFEKLNELGNTIALDDIGPGRETAIRAVDLLSNLEYSYKPAPFLYGYNFRKSVEQLPPSISKDIDLTVYLGSTPDKKVMNTILSEIPKGIKYLFIKSHGKFESNLTLDANTSFSEILCRSKFIITYFGITLYEADLCQCRIFTVNPGKYHYLLSEKVKDRFAIPCSYEYSHFNTVSMKAILSAMSNTASAFTVDTAEISDIISSNLEEFTKLINT